MRKKKRFRLLIPLLLLLLLLTPFSVRRHDDGTLDVRAPVWRVVRTGAPGGGDLRVYFPPKAFAPLAALTEKTADGEKDPGWTKSVFYAYGGAEMEIRMPDDWRYAVHKYDPLNFGFSIRITSPDGGVMTVFADRYYEEWQADKTEDRSMENGGSMTLYYHEGLDAPYEAYFPDAPGVYHAALFQMTQASSGAAVEILRQIRFLRGTISADRAKEAARAFSGADGFLKTSFDVETGVWTVQERSGGADGALNREFFVDPAGGVVERGSASAGA